MIKVKLKQGIISGSYVFKVKHDKGRVLVGLGDKVIALNTPTAHKVGFALMKKSKEALSSDYVNLSIDNEEFSLLPDQSNKLGMAIVKKMVQADDYQQAIGA